VIVILIAVLLYFSALGVHPILAAFLVGMLLADLVTSETILVKIETMGYGLFVPVFFFIVGMNMDLTIFTQFDVRNVLIISVVGGLILSKFLSGYVGGRIVKLNKRDSLMFGSVSTTQLTTTLAAAYAGSSLGLLDETLVTAVVTLSVVTNLLVPLLMRCITPPEPKGVRKIVPTIGSSIAHPGKLVGKKTDTLA
jgi:Kef-type K+ transport system membrane component KefB